MKLILIHGRGQQAEEPEALINVWVDTLRSGLAKSGLSLPGDTEVIFPFYGRQLDQLVRQAQLPSTLDGVLERGASGDQVQKAFFHDFLMELADDAHISGEEIGQHYPGLYQERGPLNWGWVQAILETLEQKTSFGSFSIRKFTYDVFLYLTLPGIRQVIDEVVSSAIGVGPCVVVGHSLGSIIGYNVLQKITTPVNKYITVGSPLGLRSVNSRLDAPLMMPACVRHGWYNAYDERDVVALFPLDKPHFSIQPPIANRNDVDNGTDNRHGITGYLNDKHIARTIYEALHLTG